MRQTPAPGATGQAAGPHPTRPSIVLFARPTRVLTAVMSFETLFVLFVFAGRYKSMPELAWFPVDFTAFFFAVSAAAACFVGWSRINIFSALQDSGFILFLLFLVWTTASILWSSFAEFNELKLFHTITLLAWSFLGGYLMVSTDWVRTRNVLVGIVILSIILLVYWAYCRFVLGLFEKPEGVALELPTYLAYAYHGQYLVAVVVGLAIASRRLISVLLSLLGLVLILGVMLLIGGRGPLLFSLLIFPVGLCMVLLNRRALRYRVQFLTLPIILLGVLSLLIVLSTWMSPGLIDRLGEEATSLHRMESYGQPGFGDSTEERILAQQFALAHWLEAPLIGWGIGEFYLLYGVLMYPHNLFIEILMEEGLVGFALLVGLAAVALARAWRLWPQDRSNWVAMAIVLMFLAELASRATVQGFLPDERPFFLFLGLVLGLGRRHVGQYDLAR
jgi:O-antigen ligase